MQKKLSLILLLWITPCAYTTTYHQLVEQAKKLVHEQKLDAAFDILTAALSCIPAKSEAHIELGNNLLWLGNQYFERSENEKALQTFKKILLISDQFAAVHHNIAFTLAERFGKHKEALYHYQKAVQLNPQNVETHFCAALSYLADGDLERGFAEYEYRWQRGEHSSRNFLEPLQNLWNGRDNLWGKTILIRAEQGLGDTLHFIRYAQILKTMGAFVIAEVQKPLVALLSHCPFLDQVLPIGIDLPPFDYQIPLLSLPHRLKTTLPTIPHQIPYLFADRERAEYWRSILNNEKRFKIGICWQGDPVHGPAKFMSLQEFLPLLQRTDVAVYSLQLQTGLDQLNELPTQFRPYIFDKEFDKTHGSFIDTAAVMKQLDLVITVDTSIAHLAGGLGIPVWVALPFPAEWRWLTERSDSPWYPTMTLFRQQKTHDWRPVMNAMMKALDAILEARVHL